MRWRSIAVGLVLALGAFVESGHTSGAAEPVVGQPVRLSVLWWGGENRHRRTLDVIDLYERSNPNIAIEPEYVGWAGYWDRLAVLAAADDMPDFYQMVVEQFPLFDRKNLMADLLQIPEFDASRIDPPAAATGLFNGRLIGAVLGTNAFALAYNPGIFERAGVAPPKSEWSWDDFVDASLRIREATGLYGVDAYGTHNDFRHWIRSQGYPSPYATDLSGPSWTDDALAEEFFQRVLLFDDHVMPPFAYTLE